MRPEDKEINRDHLISVAFNEWKDKAQPKVGTFDDLKPWLECFEAGWNACGKIIGHLIKESWYDPLP